MLTLPRNKVSPYWLSDAQRVIVDSAARALPAGEHHLFQLRVAKALRTSANLRLPWVTLTCSAAH
jgi:hypothetical protein